MGPNRSPRLPAIQKRPTAAPRLPPPAAEATAVCAETRNTPKPIPSRIKSSVSTSGDVVREIIRLIAASTTRTPARVQCAGSRAHSGPIGTRPAAEDIDIQPSTVPTANAGAKARGHLPYPGAGVAGVPAASAMLAPAREGRAPRDRHDHARNHDPTRVGRKREQHEGHGERDHSTDEHSLSIQA